MATENLHHEITRFVEDHPHGWTHEEWLGLLHHLSLTGVTVADEGTIGLSLERERLTRVLGNLEIKGLGPKRREALTARFGTLWNLMDASPEEIARVPGVPLSLAHQISDVLQ